MWIIGRRDDLDAIHPAVRRFVESGWSPALTAPGATGLSRLNVDFPGQDVIMRGAAFAINDAIRAKQKDELAFDPADKRFKVWHFDNDPILRIYRSLMDAWNQRRDLGTCENCGNLFSPKKGRTAKYCSARCRMQSARSA